MKTSLILDTEIDGVVEGNILKNGGSQYEFTRVFCCQSDSAILPVFHSARNIIIFRLGCPSLSLNCLIDLPLSSIVNASSFYATHEDPDSLIGINGYDPIITQNNRGKYEVLRIQTASIEQNLDHINTESVKQGGESTVAYPDGETKVCRFLQYDQKSILEINLPFNEYTLCIENMLDKLNESMVSFSEDAVGSSGNYSAPANVGHSDNIATKLLFNALQDEYEIIFAVGNLQVNGICGKYLHTKDFEANTLRSMCSIGHNLGLISRMGSTLRGQAQKSIISSWNWNWDFDNLAQQSTDTMKRQLAEKIRKVEQLYTREQKLKAAEIKIRDELNIRNDLLKQKQQLEDFNLYNEDLEVKVTGYTQELECIKKLEAECDYGQIELELLSRRLRRFGLQIEVARLCNSYADIATLEIDKNKTKELLERLKLRIEDKLIS